MNSDDPAADLVSVIADAEDLVSLVPEVARGSEQAFARLYDIVSPNIYGLIVQLTGSRREARELTLEVFLRIWRDAAHFDPKRSSPGTWVLSVALARTAEHLRATAG